MSIDYWLTLEAYGLTQRFFDQLIKDTFITLYMVSLSTFFGTLIGAPIGIFLASSQKNELFASPWGNRMVGFLCNLVRSVPFFILIFAILGFTRLLVGSPFTVPGAVVVLSVSAIPFIARLIETSIREVDQGLVEAARAYGASSLQIIFKVLIPEALPGIISSITLAIITLIGYSAMVGPLGVGGLGTLAYNYGYMRFEAGLLRAIVIEIVIMVQIVQFAGEWLSRRVNKRIRTH